MRPPNMLNKAGPFTFHIHSCMTMQNMQNQGIISHDLTYHKEINGDSLGLRTIETSKSITGLEGRVKDMKRYRVEFKAFKTGQWYTKTETDSIAAAFSVAKIGNYLRACRLTDTETGRILYESEEDPEMKKTNGYPPR